MTEQQGSREDRFNWTNPGEVILMSTQCEQCAHRIESEFQVCKAYAEGIPNYVQRIEENCSRYHAKRSKKERIKGAFFGFAVADAMGVPVEFTPRHRLQSNPVDKMLGYGTFNQPPGTWSDDSSLTFCLAESLCQGYNVHDIGQRFVRWRYESYWTPHGHVFDIGNATAKAIEVLKSGVAPTKAGGQTEYDNGNGSLMRILPLAFFLENVEEDAERVRIVHDVSSLTHGHVRSQIACVIYVELARFLLKGLPPHLAYNKMQESVLRFYSDSIFAPELQKYHRILKGEIYRQPEDTIRSSGYVVDTLEAALWCFLRVPYYPTIVKSAVNLGEDTDTVAAVAGGLAGLYYGYEEIPQEWLNTIARRDDIADLCERFYQAMYRE